MSTKMFKEQIMFCGSNFKVASPAPRRPKFSLPPFNSAPYKPVPSLQYLGATSCSYSEIPIDRLHVYIVGLRSACSCVDEDEILIENPLLLRSPAPPPAPTNRHMEWAILNILTFCSCHDCPLDCALACLSCEYSSPFSQNMRLAVEPPWAYTYRGSKSRPWTPSGKPIRGRPCTLGK